MPTIEALEAALDAGQLDVLDGGVLHRTVPPERWCVTKTDLRLLRILVQRCVAGRRISPTHLDMFDVNDSVIGPCIHTINHQLIKPVTVKAGNVSWALMLHPAGLKCDLFVTHAWQEGVYEFIDKVLHSWPRGTHHVYCCMLSNPQNLDIADLISSPRGSPFAKALSASTHMLVVPNRKCSIYTRIWCAYEAFLGYSENKIIMTASAPVRHIRRRVLAVSAVIAISWAISVGYCMHLAASGTSIEYVGSWGEEAKAAFLLMLAGNMLNPGLLSIALTHIAAALGAMFLGTVSWALARWVSLRNGTFDRSAWANETAICHPATEAPDLLIAVAICAAAVIAQLDHARHLQAEEEAKQLLNGYTGKLRDAQASVQKDKDEILAELESSGLEERVNHAVEVLLDSGMSTPALRIAAQRGCRVTKAGNVNWSMLVLAWSGLIWLPLTRVNWTILKPHLDYTEQCKSGWCTFCASCQEVYDESGVQSPECDPVCSHPLATATLWISAFGALQVVAWAFLFCCLPKDKRGFAAAVLTRINATCGTLLVFGQGLVLGTSSHADTLFAHWPLNFVLHPLLLLMSAAGPGQISRIPGAGTRIVNWLLLQTKCVIRAETSAALAAPA